MPNYRKPRILVTSAAGRTGTIAASELLQRGFPVRAFVRSNDARAARLRNEGAEVFVGNLYDFRDLRAAMVGVQRAYHCPPFAPNLLHNAMLFALAAEEARLEVVALMSGWNPHPAHPSMVTREHWIANNVYRLMPSVDVVHLNPGLFAFVYLVSLPVMANLGMLMAPFGEGLNAPPSNEDIGRVAAGILAQPKDHIGKCYRPTGPKLLSPSDIANVVGHVLGRKVKYTNAPFKMFAKAATAMGFGVFEIANLRYYAEELREGTYAVGAPTDHVELVTGTPAEDFETTVRRYVANPELIASGLRVGTKLGTLTFLLKMMLTAAPDLPKWEQAQSYPKLDKALLAHESPQWRKAAEAQSLLLQAGEIPKPGARNQERPGSVRPLLTSTGA